MNVKEFLKPEWKKFILPIIFIMLFLILINTFYSWGSFIDRNACELTSLIKEQQVNVKQNNTAALNQTADKMKALIQRMRNDEFQLEDSYEKINYPFMFLKGIDPVLPVPCEIMQEKVCEFYISKETYNCYKSLESESSPERVFPLAQPEVKEYKRASTITFGLNLLLLFIEGYLISAIILFVYRKFR